jgi:hypothetical protein
MHCQAFILRRLKFLLKHYYGALYLLLGGRVEFLRQSFWVTF